jgi:hypothetical protein
VFTTPTLSLPLRSISKFEYLSCIMSEKAGTLFKSRAVRSCTETACALASISSSSPSSSPQSLSGSSSLHRHRCLVLTPMATA